MRPVDAHGAALFLRAAGFGIAVAAPVGPMSLLCMRRSLIQGARYGVATGFGIAVGDGVYALVAALGLAGVSRFMLAHERPLHLAAGLFLLYLGARVALANREDGAKTWEERGTASWPAAFSSAVLLTLTNPPTIMMFAAIFTALAPRSGFAPGIAALTVGGVFTGSLLWWCGLVAAISAASHMMGTAVRRWVDHIAGTILGLFGVVQIRNAVS